MGLRVIDISEEQLVDTILDYGKTGGWLCTHFRPAKTNKGYRTALQGQKGYPDITMVHKQLQRVIFAECKSEKGSLRVEQKQWREAFMEVPGIEYYLWRPSNLPEIRKIVLGHMIGRSAHWG